MLLLCLLATARRSPDPSSKAGRERERDRWMRILLGGDCRRGFAMVDFTEVHNEYMSQGKASQSKVLGYV